MELREAVSRFILEKESYCSPRSVEYYSEGLGYFKGWASGKGLEGIENISFESLMEYQSWLRSRKSRPGGKNIKNTSVNTYMRSVRAFVKWACDCDLVKGNIRLPKRLKDDSDQVFALTSQQVSRIEGYLRDNAYESPSIKEGMKGIYYLRNMMLLRLMLDTGLRMGEAVSVSWQDLDFKARLIYVNKGKGGKDRTVPMAEKLKSGLIQLWGLYPYENAGKDTVFFDVSLEKAVTRNTVKQLFARIKKGTGLKRLHPHVLRHTFATSFIMYGGDVSVLRVLLGHSDIKVTQRYPRLASQFTAARADVYRLDPVFFRK